MVVALELLRAARRRRALLAVLQEIRDQKSKYKDQGVNYKLQRSNSKPLRPRPSSRRSRCRRRSHTAPGCTAQRKILHTKLRKSPTLSRFRTLSRPLALLCALSVSHLLRVRAANRVLRAGLLQGNARSDYKLQTATREKSVNSCRNFKMGRNSGANSNYNIFAPPRSTSCPRHRPRPSRPGSRPRRRTAHNYRFIDFSKNR